jgi:hypothetical protein
MLGWLFVGDWQIIVRASAEYLLFSNGATVLLAYQKDRSLGNMTPEPVHEILP